MSKALVQHLAATWRLIAEMREQLKRDNPAGCAAFDLATEQGAAFRVVTGVSAAGLAEATIELLTPGDDPVRIATVELECSS